MIEHIKTHKHTGRKIKELKIYRKEGTERNESERIGFWTQPLHALLANLQKKVCTPQSPFPLPLSPTEDISSPSKHCLVFILWPLELKQIQREILSVRVDLRACTASRTFT